MDVAELHDRLAERAFLYDDPDAYMAGVDEALEILLASLETARNADDARTLRGA